MIEIFAPLCFFCKNFLLIVKVVEYNYRQFLSIENPNIYFAN